jgi:Nif-specific regulatory protein/two-component system response regulator HydG
VEVRIVAATHQELGALVKAGKFRQDLYYRLNVLELRIPPLRERRADIPLLVEHFVRKYWRRPGQAGRFTARAEQVLRGHAYPGNVRELEHLVERACLLARGPEMDLELLPAELAVSVPAAALPKFTALSNEEIKAARDAAVGTIERCFLEALMQRWEGNVTRAARESGIHRSQLQRLLAAHGLGPEQAAAKRGNAS